MADRPVWRHRPVILGAVVIAISYAIPFLGRGPLDWLIQEDGLVEDIGALGLITTSALFFAAFVRSRHSSSHYSGRVMQISLILLIIAFFIGAGEEISWGQRIFGWGTPESVQSANSQGELNFHNLNFFSGALEVNKLHQVFWVAFGVVVPLGCAVSERVRGALRDLIPIFPLWLAFLFVIQQVVGESVDAIVNANPSLYHGTYYPTVSSSRFEITESATSVLLAIGAFLVLRAASRDPDKVAVVREASERPEMKPWPAPGTRSPAQRS